MLQTKTHLCRVWDEPFDFLGYTIGRCYSPQTGRCYIGTYPSKKRVQRICASISELTSRRWLWRDAHEQVGSLNRMMRGWANYFNLGPVSKAYRAVDAHVRGRLRQWLRSKHKIDSAGWSRYPDRYLYKTLGLVELSLLTRRLPWAKA